MFVLEGILSVLLGFAVLRFLTDRPSQATWLTEEQRAWLTTDMDAEHDAAARATGGGGHHHGLGDVLRSLLSWNALRLALIYFGLLNIEVGLVAAVPCAAAIAAIDSIGNLGGFFGPTLIGYAREATGSFTLGLMVSCFTPLASTLFTLSLRRREASARTAAA